MEVGQGKVAGPPELHKNPFGWRERNWEVFPVLCLVSRTTMDTSVPLEMRAKTRGQSVGIWSPVSWAIGKQGAGQSRAGRGS